MAGSENSTPVPKDTHSATVARTPSGRRIAHLDIPTLRSCAASYRREADHLAGLGAEEAARNLIQAAEEHEARAAELEAPERVAGGHLSPDGTLSASIGQSPIPGTPVDHPPGVTAEVPTQAATPQEPDLSSPASGSIDRPAESADQHLTEPTMLMMTDTPSGATAMSIPSSFVIPPVGTPSGPSSVIPTIGVTFTEAETRAMICPESLGLTGDAADRHSCNAVKHASAIHVTPPTTLEDAMVKLRVATGELGYGAGECPMAGESIDQVRDWLEQNGAAALAGKGVSITDPLCAEGDGTSIIPSLGMTFAKAEPLTIIPGPGANIPTGEHLRLIDFAIDHAEAIWNTPPKCPGDVMVKLRVLLGTLGGMTGADGTFTAVRQVIELLDQYHAGDLAEGGSETLPPNHEKTTLHNMEGHSGGRDGARPSSSSTSGRPAKEDDAAFKVYPACVNGLPKRGTLPETHPDAEILFAWDTLVNAVVAYQCAPDGEEGVYEDAAFNIGMRIEEFRAKTKDGMAVQLRYSLIKYINTDDAWSVIAFEDDMTPGLKEIIDNDPHAAMLWNMICSGLPRVDHLNRERFKGGDAFGAGVQAFATEGERLVAAPVAPSASMIDAGALAAGITPDRFRAAYSAAIGSLMKDRAA